jgi:hypothetical protein
MMPGVISLGSDGRWLATGWLFCWVVGFLAMNVERQQLAADIDHARADDAGLLELETFGPEAGREIRALLRDRLVPVAEERFPVTMCGRTAAMRLLRELAVLAAESPVERRSSGESDRTAEVTKAAYLRSRTASVGM